MVTDGSIGLSEKEDSMEDVETFNDPQAVQAVGTVQAEQTDFENKKVRGGDE